MFIQGSPYAIVQYLLRKEVGILLARHNGLTDEARWNELVPDQIQRKKLQLRLCSRIDGKFWKWKPELVNTEILRKRAPKAEHFGLVDLFEESQLQSRCRFPYLAPANKPHLFRHANDLESQIYGFDILIRPIPSAGFSSKSDNQRNDLHLGHLSFCIIIHAGVDVLLEGSVAANYNEIFLRTACGDDLISVEIIGNLLSLLARNDFRLRDALRRKKWCELAFDLTSCANEAARISFLT